MYILTRFLPLNKLIQNIKNLVPIFLQTKMVTPIVEGVNTNETSAETHNLSVHEPEDVKSATSKSGTPVTSEEVARQIKAATDSSTRQLEWLCDLMKELKRATTKRNEETSGLFQSILRPHSSRFHTRWRKTFAAILYLFNAGNT